MVAATIGKDNIALEKKKQSALTKAVKRVKKNPLKPVKKNVQNYRRGIIMLKHVPHGFYEKEMRGYFSQFGRVLRIRVARSEKTGKSRGYAFVEFEFEEVAKIAAESMNNYLMFERLIKCELLSPEVKSRNIFQDRHMREDNYPKLKSREHNTEEQNRIMTEEQAEDVMQQRQKKIQEQNKRLAEMGIDYSFQVGTKRQQTRKLSESSPAKKVKTPDSSKATTSPKMRKSGDNQAAKMRKSEDSQATKMRKSEESQAAKMLKAESPVVKKTPVKNSKDLTLVSPKSAKKADSPVVSVVEAESHDDGIPSPAEKKRKSLPKISPKVLRSRKSQGGNILKSAESHDAKKTPAKKSLPAISPKLLRNRKSHGPNVVEADSQNDAKKTPAKKSLPTISPKMLRSRKSQGAAMLEVGSTDLNKTPAGKKKDLPKISPKLLRSRKSDGAALTPLASKAAPSTPSKQKKAGRKSVF